MFFVDQCAGYGPVRADILVARHELSPTRSISNFLNSVQPDAQFRYF